MSMDRQVVLETVLAHPETPAWAHPILRRALSGDMTGVTITGRVIDAALLNVLRDLSIDPLGGEADLTRNQRHLDAFTPCEGSSVATLFCSCYASMMEAHVDLAARKVVLIESEDYARPTEEIEAVALKTLLSCPELPAWARPLLEVAKPGENTHANIDFRLHQFDASYLGFLRQQIQRNARGEEWNAVLRKRLEAHSPWVDSPSIRFYCHELSSTPYRTFLDVMLSPDGRTIRHLEEY